MATQTRLELFLGTDFTFRFAIANDEETEALDITGWALSFMIKRSGHDADVAALLTKTTPTITITGAYDAVIADNLQRANVAILDTDTDAIAAGMCAWELKRTDAGFETILGYGPIKLQRSVHRS
jgi:hypothetical protein